MGNAEKTNGSVLGRMKLKAKEVQDGVKETIAEVSEAGQDKVKEATESVNEILVPSI